MWKLLFFVVHSHRCELMLFHFEGIDYSTQRQDLSGARRESQAGGGGGGVPAPRAIFRPQRSLHRHPPPPSPPPFLARLPRSSHLLLLAPINHQMLCHISRVRCNHCKNFCNEYVMYYVMMLLCLSVRNTNTL